MPTSTKMRPRCPLFFVAARGIDGQVLIAYRHEEAGECLNFKLCKKWFHLLTVAWTVRDGDDAEAVRKQFDLIIFEHFLP